MDGELNINLCVICQKHKPLEECKQATDVNFNSFMESAKSRQLVIDTKYGAYLEQYLSLSKEVAKYHKKCYSSFTNKTLISRLKKKTFDSEAGQENTSIPTEFTDCVLCQSKKKERSTSNRNRRHIIKNRRVREERQCLMLAHKRYQFSCRARKIS